MKPESTTQNPFDRARALLNVACERIKRGESTVQRDSQGTIIPSRKPNAVDMMVNRATGREDQ